MFHFANGHFSAKEIQLLVKEAGFDGNSPLQRQLIPELPHEKDLLIEAGPEEEKELALLLPVIVRKNPASKNVHTLVLTGDSGTLIRAESIFRRLSGKRVRGQQLSVLGQENQARKELKLISRHPNIIVGTPERIIDHLRRGNLELSELKTMILDVPEEPEREGFEQDAEFILSKCSGRIQSVVFASEPDKLEFLKGFQRRPTILKRDKRESCMLQLAHYTVSGECTETTGRILLSRGRVEECLVVFDSRSEAEKLKLFLQRSGISAALLPDLSKAGTAGCIISPTITGMVPLHGIRAILFSGIFPTAPQVRNIITESGSSPDNVELLVVSSNIEEHNSMNLEEKKLPSDEEVLKGHIENILKTIKIDEDPELLNRYRKIVRKNVPFFMRSYLAAYLLKETGGKLKLSGSGERAKKEPGRRRKKEQMESSGGKQTLFVSIGKNRKVYPKDLVQLFRATLSLEKEDVGAVKVLDNYSFVEINESRSQDAIEKMDGMEFRGRKITVNFARKK